MKSKKYYFQNAAIIILALAIIVMSVGYATYSTSLKLNGDVTVPASKWSIIFKDPKKHSSTTITDDKINEFKLTDSTSLKFSANMGIHDTYSFVVDVVNDGTFDAKLTNWSITAKNVTTNTNLAISESNDEANNAFLTYSVKWLDGTALTENEPLQRKMTTNNNNVKKLWVTVETHEPSSVDDLPATDQTFEFNFQMTYGTIF